MTSRDFVAKDLETIEALKEAPRASYYDWDLRASRSPNRVLHEMDRRRTQSYMRLVQKRPDVLLDEVHRRRGEPCEERSLLTRSFNMVASFKSLFT